MSTPDTLEDFGTSWGRNTHALELIKSAETPSADSEADSPSNTESVPPSADTPGETPAEQLSEEQRRDAMLVAARILGRLEDTPENRQWACLRAVNSVGHFKDPAALARQLQS